MEAKKRPPPIWLGYLLGLAGVTLLVLLGGGHNLFALSLSLLLPGFALLIHPPDQSPGVWMDRLTLGLLAVLLLAFVPSFYWPDPDWRTAAEELFQINLPASLSVQPLLSFEAWVLALAGFCWFYAASSWRINHQGRKWFSFAICLVVGILAAIVLWGNTMGARYPFAEEANVFSFFPNRNQTANFLAVGGVAAFGYAVCALRTRQLMPLVGFVTACLSFMALVSGVSRAGVVIFFLGLFLVYFMQLGTGRVAKGVKLGFPLVLIGLSVFIVSNSRTTERVMGFVASPEKWSYDYRSLMAADSLEMIGDAPLAGHGLGTFSAVFPQYRDSSANYRRALHPESDLLWLGAEAGILGAALLLGFVVAYLARCRGLGSGPSDGYRLAALAPLLVFMLHALVDVPGHRPGTVYFAILFAALALPQPKIQRPTFKPRIWRACGGFLVVCGLLWGLAGLTGLPIHSKVILADQQEKIEANIAAANYQEALLEADQWIDLKPLDWQAYFRRATLHLSASGSEGKAAADFRRARFVEPVLGVVALEEGFTWIPYDTGRALSAWREVLFRELENREKAFRRMLDAAAGNPELRDGLALLSEWDTTFRLYFLGYQSGDYLMRELGRDLAKDARLGHFTDRQRFVILQMWIRQGDQQAAETFLLENEPSLDRSWWLWSLLRKEQAEFEQAVNHIRRGITPPALPKVSIEEVPLDRLRREFSIAPGDIMKGTTLLRIYREQGDYQKVRDVTQTMIAAEREAPLFVIYWHAESYFQLQDYIESWYAFEGYLEQLWEQE